MKNICTFNYVDVGVKSLSLFNASTPLSTDCDSLEFWIDQIKKWIQSNFLIDQGINLKRIENCCIGMHYSILDLF